MLLSRSVLLEAGRNFAGSLLATTAMAFFVLSVTTLKRTPGVGMDFLLNVFPLFFPLALQFTVPLAVLVACVFTFGRMAGDGELIALAASGVPLSRVIRPMLAGAACVALGALALGDHVAPFAAHRIRQAKLDLPRQIQTSMRAGKRDLDFGKAHLSFERFQDGRLTDAVVETRGPKGEIVLFRAQSGGIAVTEEETLLLQLDRAGVVREGSGEGERLHLSVESLGHELPIAAIVGESSLRRKRTDLRAWELAYAAARGLEEGENRPLAAARAEEELARRTALPASAFFFALVGIPMGVFSARGGRIATFFFAVGPVLLVFFPLVIAGANLARNGRVPAYPALWAGNAVLLVAGLALLRKAGRR
jgi:lipopolysaccharide export LptBFGC system permease protein LptF